MRQLFRVFIPASLTGLILSEITLIFLCYLTGIWLVSVFINPDLDLASFVWDEGGLVRILLVVACVAFGIYFQDLYSNIRLRSLTVLIQQICVVIGFAFLFQSLLAYIHKPEWGVSHWGMIFGSALLLLTVPAWRLFYHRVVLKVVGSTRVIFLGTSPLSQEIAAHLAARPEIGMNVLGYIDDADRETNPLAGKILGQTKDLTALAQNLKPDLIVVGMNERRRELPLSEMLHLRFSGLRFEEAAVTFEATFGRVSTRQMRPSRLIFSSDLGPRKGSLFWQSVYAIPISAFLLLLFSPVMLIVALLVKLTSPGPVFHRQVRVGLDGANFPVFKFRSMYIDAEARTGPVWAQKNDPRITSVGRWIRRYRLDELPQLFNVLRGEMTLVGPRPERPQFVASLTEQIPYYNYRHCVKPGITGWAQINYKYGDTFEDSIMKLEYDLYYIKNLTVSLDLFIIFHTMKVMLFSDSAQ